MKTKQNKTKQLIVLIIIGFSFFNSINAQVATAITTSYGVGAGVPTVANGSSFFGYQAGTLVTPTLTGGSNSFFGRSSGRNVTSGIQNSFFGYVSGSAGGVGISTGNSNSFFGNEAGPYANANNSVCIGSNTMNYNTNSAINNCTIIGSRAGIYGGGTENILLGYQAGANKTGNNNIFIGNNVGESNSNRLNIDNQATTTPLIWGDFANDQVKLNGKVGIGSVGIFPTTAGTVNVANYKLFVTGGILTDEVRVNLSNAGTWADYVFSKDYKLPSLQEVEKQIQEKGHLSNMPSAKEVKENGIELGEMAKMQQEKIEELTLYAIEQNKTNEKQSKEIAELKALVTKLINK
jgi:hypothetical protein